MRIWIYLYKLKLVFLFKLISAAVGRQGASSAQIALVRSPYPACPAGVSCIRTNHQSKNLNSTYIANDLKRGNIAPSSALAAIKAPSLRNHFDEGLNSRWYPPGKHSSAIPAIGCCQIPAMCLENTLSDC